MPLGVGTRGGIEGVRGGAARLEDMGASAACSGRELKRRDAVTQAAAGAGKVGGDGGGCIDLFLGAAQKTAFPLSDTRAVYSCTTSGGLRLTGLLLDRGGLQGFDSLLIVSLFLYSPSCGRAGCLSTVYTTVSPLRYLGLYRDRPEEKYTGPGDGGNGEIRILATLSNTVTLAVKITPAPPGHW